MVDSRRGTKRGAEWIGGLCLMAQRIRRTRAEVAQILADLVQGTGGRWDWEDFISNPIQDDRLEEIRARCTHLDDEFPREANHSFTGPGGYEVIRRFIDELKASET